MQSTLKEFKLTTAQALVKYLSNQFITIHNQQQRLCGGGFAIFGHGNVPCLGEALYNHKTEIPIWRGQNEQSMGLAAIGYAKYYLRRRFMLATASAGPGTTNLLTAAAAAHTNRMPFLMLCGDIFLTRLPDPVLQQVEHFNNPTIGVNDAFKSVTRYWDRITHPAQLLPSLPAAIQTLLDPADCGPAFLGLPQDVQGWVYNYPAAFFEPKTHYIRRQPPDPAELQAALNVLKTAKSPLIIAGGGVQYATATAELKTLSQKMQIPVVETIAGRANLNHDDPMNFGPIGVTGSDCANHLAQQADVVLAIGTRMQDFTTGSWTVFNPTAKILGFNVGRVDACKHASLAVIGDAKLSMQQLLQTEYKAPESWLQEANQQRQTWQTYVNHNTSPAATKQGTSYAQVVGAVNELCDKRDRIITAAGGLPAEVCANWRTKDSGTVDIEFGYSCMSYEISGAWGARIAQTEQEPQADCIVFVGDGSYLMHNSDIYSSVLSGKKLIIILCDNGGFAVIEKLQRNTGNQSFNNLLKDCKHEGEVKVVDFVAHAKALGATSEKVGDLKELKAAFNRAKQAQKTYVICIETLPLDGWTEKGHAWWEVGLPQTTESPDIQQAQQELEQGRQQQRKV